MAPGGGMRPPPYLKNITSEFFLSKGNAGTKTGAQLVFLLYLQ